MLPLGTVDRWINEAQKLIDQNGENDDDDSPISTFQQKLIALENRIDKLRKDNFENSNEEDLEELNDLNALYTTLRRKITPIQENNWVGKVVKCYEKVFAQYSQEVELITEGVSRQTSVPPTNSKPSAMFNLGELFIKRLNDAHFNERREYLRRAQRFLDQARGEFLKREFTQARSSLCVLARIKESQSFELKQSILNQLIEVMSSDPIFKGRFHNLLDKSAPGLVENAFSLKNELDSELMQGVKIQTQILIVKAYALNIDLLLRYFAAGHFGALKNESKIDLFQAGKDLSRLNAKNDPDLQFWLEFAAEGIKRIKSDNELEELLQRLGDLATAISKALHGEYGKAIEAAVKAVKGLDSKLKSSWFGWGFILYGYSRAASSLKDVKQMEVCWEQLSGSPYLTYLYILEMGYLGASSNNPEVCEYVTNVLCSFASCSHLKTEKSFFQAIERLEWPKPVNMNIVIQRLACQQLIKLYELCPFAKVRLLAKRTLKDKLISCQKKIRNKDSKEEKALNTVEGEALMKKLNEFESNQNELPFNLWHVSSSVFVDPRQPTDAQKKEMQDLDVLCIAAEAQSPEDNLKCFKRLIAFISDDSNGLPENMIGDEGASVQILLDQTSQFTEMHCKLALVLAQSYLSRPQKNLKDCQLAMAYFAKAFSVARVHNLEEMKGQVSRSVIEFLFSIFKDSYHEDLIQAFTGQTSFTALMGMWKGDVKLEKQIIDWFEWMERVQSLCISEDQLQVIECVFREFIAFYTLLGSNQKTAFKSLHKKIFPLVNHPLALHVPAECLLSQYRESLKKVRQKFQIDGQALGHKALTVFLQQMIKDAFVFAGPPPKCRFDIRALGSIGKGESICFSDLEWMIVSDRDERNVKEYFYRFAMIFDLLILSLDETSTVVPLKFTSLKRDPTKGLSFEKSANPVDCPWCITTPQELLNLYLLPIEDHTSFSHASLKSESLFTNDPSLFETHEKEVANIEQLHLRQMGLTLMRTRLVRFREVWGGEPFPLPLTRKIDVKKDFYDFFVYLMSDLGIYFGILKEKKTFELIDALVENGIFHPNSRSLLIGAMQQLVEMRMQLQILRGEANEVLAPSDQTMIDMKKDLERFLMTILVPLYNTLDCVLKEDNLQHITKRFNSVKSPFYELDLITNRLNKYVELNLSLKDIMVIFGILQYLAKILCKLNSSPTLHKTICEHIDHKLVCEARSLGHTYLYFVTELAPEMAVALQPNPYIQQIPNPYNGMR